MGKVSKKKIDAVVAGHICLDITPVFRSDNNLSFKQIFTPGALTNISGVNITVAGAVPNVGISLKLLGLHTHLMGKIGKDLFGNGILQFLKKMNMEISIARTKGERTSLTIVMVPPGIDRIFFHDPGANDSFTADDIDYEIIKQSRLFHFGYPPLMKRMFENDGEELVKIFRNVKEQGVITSLDMAFTETSSDAGKADWIKILKRVLPYVDIFIPSAEEILYMVERDYFNNLNSCLEEGESLTKNLDVNILPMVGEKLLSFGTKILGIKCGIKGLYIRTNIKDSLSELQTCTSVDIKNWSDRELLAETYDVKGIKSTTGAGDCCIAGFLTSFLNGRPVEEAMKIANSVATRSITSYDVFSHIIGFDSAVAEVKSGMPVIRLEIADTYWKFDRNSGVWKGKWDELSN